MTIGGNMVGSAVVTGDHNVADVRYRKFTLPPAESIDIRAELAALRDLLAGLTSADRQKIDHQLLVSVRASTISRQHVMRSGLSWQHHCTLRSDLAFEPFENGGAVQEHGVVVEGQCRHRLSGFIWLTYSKLQNTDERSRSNGRPSSVITATRRRGRRRTARK